MASIGQPIEAVLTLNATGFHTGLNDVKESVKSFVTQVNGVKSNTAQFTDTIDALLKSINDVAPAMARFNGVAKETDSFNKFANGVKALASAVEILGKDSNDASVGITRVKEIIKSLEGTLAPVEVNIKGVSSALRSMGSKNTGLENLRNSIKQTQESLLELGRGIPSLNRIDTTSNKVKQSVAMMDAEFKRAKNDLLALGQGVVAFNNIDSRSNKVKSQVAMMNAEFNRSKQFLEQLAWTGVESFNRIETGIKKTSVAEKQLSASTNQASASLEKQASASDRATASTNRQTSATRGLGRALSSLKMMGTMVGSMIAYNFIHNLAMATTETINAKSEMNGYFQMLGYTTRQTQEFNRALDQTVAKFPRLNKYALGETISSIGVEFELTTAEMKKAMPVVSMITSEYLRAGRNVNEASLAVKDILQGEFQRLSRETGVKGDQLKEAGWSGDKNDVMGLLKALEKVGKERNWDTFVQKANSLNDAVLILQNRFSEWSADMVERIQPTIVGVFNTMMSVAGLFADSIEGVANWLGGEGLGQSIVKWGGFATALGLVVTALIHYRTGATLTQIAQMGLTKSIGASILGLEAETVAQYGLRNAIVTTVTGIEAETLANEENIITRKARLQAITSTITGYEMETVASKGVLKSLIASSFGAKESTLTQYGLSTAIAEATTQMEAQKLASMSLAQRIALIGATTIPAMAIVGAFAVAFGKLVLETKQATDNMTKFYDIQQHGKEHIDEAKDSVKNLQSHIKELKKTQSDYAKGSEEYKNVGKAIDDLNSKMELAKQNAKDNYEALQIVNSAQNNYDTTKQELQLELQRKINQSLVDTGLSTEEANELSNNYLNDAIDGSRQLYKALQSVALQYSKEAGGVASLTDYWSQRGLSAEEIKVKIDPYIDTQNAIVKDIETMKTSTDMMEVTTAWLKLQVDQIQLSLQENLPKIEAGDWAGGLTGMLKGLAHGLADLPVFGDFWNWVFEYANVKENYGGKGWEGLGQWINDSIYQFFNYIFEGFSNGTSLSEFSSQFMELLNNFIQDPFGMLGIDLSGFDIVGSIANALLNGGSTEGGGGFTAKQIDITWLMSIFPTWEEITSAVNTYIVSPISNGISTGIANIPIVSDIARMLGLIPQQDQNANTQGYNLIDQFKQGVEKKIGEIPIIGDIARMLGLIPQQNSNANSKGHGIGSNIDQGTRGGMQNMGQFILSEFNDALAGIGQLGQQAYNTARDWAGQLWDGVNSILQRHSPGFFHDQFMLEFGTDIPNAITSSGDTAYSVAQYYGQRIKDGVSSVNTDVSLDGMVGEYQDDAQIVASSSQLMGSTTTTAFNQMQTSVNATTTQMTGNVTSSYSTMQQRQATLLNNMKTSNTTAYNEMYTKSNQSLLHMRDSTANVTHQMTNAWSHMKDQIVASANRLKSESTSHFNQLSSTIGSFYRKIQNPSNWGAGSPNIRSSAPRPSKGRKAVRTIRGARHGAGVNPYQSSESLTLRELLRMTGVSDNTKMDLNTFLASIWGEHGFGWNDWSGRHYNYIKEKSDAWSMKPPMIMGYIPAGDGFKVGEFEGGQPHITWSTFMSTAEALFSTIPYKFYWDSNWKGDWVSALKAGATNCSDGSDALIALAETMGFSGVKVHTTTRSGLGHFYAVINGRKMDTTNYQHNRSWTPLGAGIPTRAYGRSTSGAGQVQGKTVNITVDMSNSTVYGVDDLDSRIQDGVQKGLQEEFNDPYTVAI